MSSIPLSSYFNPASHYHHGFEHLKSAELSWGRKILAIILGSLLTVGVVTYPLGLYVFRKLTKSTEKLGAQADKVNTTANSILNTSKKSLDSQPGTNEPKRTEKEQPDLSKTNTTGNSSIADKQSTQKEVPTTKLDESFLNGVPESVKQKYFEFVRPCVDKKEYGRIFEIFYKLKHDSVLYKTEACKEFGLFCFREGNYAYAIKFFGIIYDEESRGQLCRECAESCLRDKKYDDAKKFIQLMSGEKSVSMYKNFATTCFSNEKYDESIKFLNSIYNTKITDPIYREFALSCCKAGKYDDSIKFINRIFGNPKLKEEIFLDVAKEHYDNKNYEKALETVGKLEPHDEDGEVKKFLIRITEDYQKQGKHT